MPLNIFLFVVLKSRKGSNIIPNIDYNSHSVEDNKSILEKLSEVTPC